MIRFLKNISLVLLLIIAGYSPIFYFNIIEDPYSIFTNDFSSRRIEPNSHFIKMRYVANSKTGFDSFIFGNSRANNVNPKLFTNGKYYNMYYSLGVPGEYLDDIRLLLRKKKRIKNIVVFLDYSSFTTWVGDRESDMLRLPYTDNKLLLLKRYIKYGFQIPDTKFKEEYYKSEPTPVYAKIFETGQAENKAAEDFIEKNRTAHVADPKFNSPYIGYGNTFETTLSNLDTIKKLCDANKINLVFAMNPIHKTTWNANNKDLYYEFIKRLSSISEFYDFSGVNKITSNNYFYYETSHYRPIVGEAMARYIQYKTKIDSVPDFGQIINKNNVAERISVLKTQN